MIKCVHGINVYFLLPSLKDKENQDLAVAMNSVVVHSRFVDSFDELFIETCDLSFIGLVMVFIALHSFRSTSLLTLP